MRKKRDIWKLCKNIAISRSKPSLDPPQRSHCWPSLPFLLQHKLGLWCHQVPFSQAEEPQTLKLFPSRGCPFLIHYFLLNEILLPVLPVWSQGARGGGRKVAQPEGAACARLPQWTCHATGGGSDLKDSHTAEGPIERCLTARKGCCLGCCQVCYLALGELVKEVLPQALQHCQVVTQPLDGPHLFLQKLGLQEVA